MSTGSKDPLLIAAQVLLYVLLAGVLIAAISGGVGLVTYCAAYGVPWWSPIWAAPWHPITNLLFALGALWLVADTTVAVLGMIGTVSRGAPFERANISRLERIAHNTIGLAVLGVIAKIAGSGISGSINGVEIGVDLPGSIGFALLLFILARVFRRGAAMQDDLAGTV